MLLTIYILLTCAEGKLNRFELLQIMQQFNESKRCRHGPH
jgi:hypothetical protein